ncbi:50S ribosomal protein L4 sunset domain variant [Actinokineospora sp. HUAS TT18]|uniref:50S ribosomal protein L4, sunset domain variant n=1 Tax=Actinokineospora sp. HUAS TT18 TaxID=3447451 RepID=UPI003F51E7F1
MTSVDIKTPAGKTDGSVELPADVFDVQANIPLMHQVVVAQMAAARQGTHSTKTRGEVSGGGKKPYRQKGTGRARQGSTRAPQFVGGGVVHGPQPRDYAQRTPKKMKAAALRGALSDRARAGQVHVVSGLVEGDTPSTKTARKLIESVTAAKRVLVVLTRDEDVAWVSLRNLPHVHLIAPDQLNTYDVLVNDDVVFSKAALDAFLSRPVRAAKSVASSAEVQSLTGPRFGEGSHDALEDGSQPEGFPIKGNADSMLFHVPGSAFYDRTVAEVWFATAEAAEAAGFQLPPSQRKSEEDK